MASNLPNTFGSRSSAWRLPGTVGVSNSGSGSPIDTTSCSPAVAHGTENTFLHGTKCEHGPLPVTLEIRHDHHRTSPTARTRSPVHCRLRRDLVRQTQTVIRVRPFASFETNGDWLSSNASNNPRKSKPIKPTDRYVAAPFPIAASIRSRDGARRRLNPNNFATSRGASS